MSMAVINMLRENEATFGVEGQRAVNRALIKTGYDLGKEIVEDAEIPEDITPMELMSFIATIINTQAWTSIEEPFIDSDEDASFNILWCPLQDIYRAFDCRVQRYLVQGIIDAIRESNPFNIDYQIEFTKTIPAGGDCCNFIITEKKPSDNDKWESYSKFLEIRAMKRLEGMRKDEDP
jgi:hypothetical protein